MKTLIIAEAGVNHNGSLQLAKKLVDTGADAGVDVVKFQTFNPGALTSALAQTAEYQKVNTGKDESQLEMLRNLTLSEQDHYELAEYCKSKNVQFCSSPFDLGSIAFLKKLGVPFWKIPSGEITNLPYLREIARFNEPVILSTGMSNLSDIESALNILLESGVNREKISLLHCNTEYPTPASDVNLNAMKTLRSAFCMNVGYSDHTRGIEFPIAAVALGATIIEKHITLNKAMEGPDHRASLEPHELFEMVKAIRNIEIGMGSSVKRPSESEMKNISV
ncbi:MAG: N-acetylneuraminate synthase, partial [Spirochaetaceae bacterium]|nr:N-acetylneuraminate synthase [Spirochaetaceae bacterium]